MPIDWHKIVDKPIPEGFPVLVCNPTLPGRAAEVVRVIDGRWIVRHGGEVPADAAATMTHWAHIVFPDVYPNRFTREEAAPARAD